MCLISLKDNGRNKNRNSNCIEIPQFSSLILEVFFILFSCSFSSFKTHFTVFVQLMCTQRIAIHFEAHFLFIYWVLYALYTALGMYHKKNTSFKWFSNKINLRADKNYDFHSLGLSSIDSKS